jgi:methyltransferase (TIGR00027 family)
METSNMKPNEPSRTALMIARQRAAHQVLDHGSILYDPFAMKILHEDEKDVLQFANGHPLASIGRLLTAARSRIAEDALSRAVESGIRQIVILGAGLDTFALRNPHGARQTRIYEVDHPATQAWKRERLAEAQIALPPWLIFVPVDFEQDDVGDKLVAAGFQQNSPAFFTWLGVVPYLTQDAIGRTLDYMSSIQNSEVVFDYMEPPQAFSEEMRELVTKRTEQLEKMDERWASRFEPAGIAAILRSHGFSDIEDINFQEIKSRFGPSVQGLAPGHAGVHVIHAKQ